MFCVSSKLSIVHFCEPFLLTTNFQSSPHPPQAAGNMQAQQGQQENVAAWWIRRFHLSCLLAASSSSSSWLSSPSYIGLVNLPTWRHLRRGVRMHPSTIFSTCFCTGLPTWASPASVALTFYGWDYFHGQPRHDRTRSASAAGDRSVRLLGGQAS